MYGTDSCGPRSPFVARDSDWLAEKAFALLARDWLGEGEGDLDRENNPRSRSLRRGGWMTRSELASTCLGNTVRLKSPTRPTFKNASAWEVIIGR